MSIEINNLIKDYEGQKAVNSISFRVAKGEIVGFLGPNGAGKSTTMKILTGYIPPTSGQASVCGIDVISHPLEAKKKIGYLPESNALYYDMYVREYLGFIADTHQLPHRGQAVERAIEVVGLNREAHKKIGQLSKGYKQRVGLAAALIHDPEVLILDEPTSGLDPNQIIEIREVIRRQGQDKTVLFSSHILQEVEAICDRVIIINLGTLVADDTLSNLQQKRDGQQAVIVKFDAIINKQLLENIPGVKAIEVLSGGQYKLLTEDADNVRKQILKVALEHNLNIVSLQSEEQRLEDIFRSLTAAQPAAQSVNEQQ
ncbi:gliding motility-associated ABC transporter ATP-binding subunit GldA [Nostoc ellipsosporum NOK]|nr:gliding motility-associated ABC transporter ATP-binding subunit GldA [Nostoc ellipsosporum NOK]